MGPSGGVRHGKAGTPPCSGGRTRTLNNWTRTSRVADYTTPEWVDDQISRALRAAVCGADQDRTRVEAPICAIGSAVEITCTPASRSAELPQASGSPPRWL